MKEFFILIYLACLRHIISTQSDVRLPPTLTRWPQRKEVSYYQDNQFTLECDAQGTPAVRYEWKKNGFQLNTNLSRIRKGSDGTITINRATDTDEGHYQCFAMNQYGTALSDMMDVRMIFFIVTAGTAGVVNKTVVEGMQFHIENFRTRSFPEPWYAWDIRAEVNEETTFTPVEYSGRIQVAKNGDLHFAYALREDAPNGTMYLCSTSIQNTGSIARTQLTVTRNPSGNISEFAPTLALNFTSATETVALVGETMKLRCFFYGYPEPMISWTAPTNRPLNVSDFNTTLNLNPVDASDEGNYTCTASNTQGDETLTFEIRVEVEPNFNKWTDGPYDVNATEGDSVTFKCNAFAKPQAKIVWLQNGQPVDTNNPPERFVFSNDNRSLTIRDVCRDCFNQERQTDLMVIQCNASNVHGYAFASGYLNVLMKTNVTIRGPRNVSVDFLAEMQFVYQCVVTSDPSTPPTVHWYKTEPYGDLVRDELPYVYVTKEFLVIKIEPQCSANCTKYLGEYSCVGDNGYSRENQTITLSYNTGPQTEDITKNKHTWDVWKIILVAGAICLLLFLLGMFIAFLWKRRFGEENRQTIEKRMPNPFSIYKEPGYDLIDVPLEDVVQNNDRSMRRESGEYEHIGYESIDKVLEEIENREGAMRHSVDVHGHSRHESLDASQRDAKGRGRQTLDKDIICDDMGYSIPLEDATNGEETDQPQIHGYESVHSDDKLDLNSEEANCHSDLVSKAMSQYLDLFPNDVNQYLELDPKEVNQYLDLDPIEVNEYLDLVSNDVNPYLDLEV